jgi:purine-binding chemotaxis protein CheW
MIGDDEQDLAGEPDLPPAGEPAKQPLDEREEDAAEALAALIAGIDEEMAGAADEVPPETGTPAGWLEAAPRGGAPERIVLFSLAGTRYALPLRNVLETGAMPAVTTLPNVPGWVRGVTNLRGDVIAVLDLRRFLGVAEREPAGSSRMLVLRLEGNEPVAGMLVDQIHGIASLAAERLGSPTASLADRVVPFLRGVSEQAGRLLVHLDLEKLLQSEEFKSFGRS